MVAIEGLSVQRFEVGIKSLRPHVRIPIAIESLVDDLTVLDYGKYL
jgi:hypothetical protein